MLKYLFETSRRDRVILDCVSPKIKENIKGKYLLYYKNRKSSMQIRDIKLSFVREYVNPNDLINNRVFFVTIDQLSIIRVFSYILTTNGNLINKEICLSPDMDTEEYNRKSNDQVKGMIKFKERILLL